MTSQISVEEMLNTVKNWNLGASVEEVLVLGTNHAITVKTVGSGLGPVRPRCKLKYPKHK